MKIFLGKNFLILRLNFEIAPRSPYSHLLGDSYIEKVFIVIH